MVIDFLCSQENCAVWPQGKPPYSTAFLPAFLTEQLFEFDV
jgi:hypothetical protein